MWSRQDRENDNAPRHAIDLPWQSPILVFGFQQRERRSRATDGSAPFPAPDPRTHLMDAAKRRAGDEALQRLGTEQEFADGGRALLAQAPRSREADEMLGRVTAGCAMPFRPRAIKVRGLTTMPQSPRALSRVHQLVAASTLAASARSTSRCAVAINDGITRPGERPVGHVPRVVFIHLQRTLGGEQIERRDAVVVAAGDRRAIAAEGVDIARNVSEAVVELRRQAPDGRIRMIASRPSHHICR